MYLQILASPRCILSGPKSKLSGPKSYLRHLAKNYSGKPCDRFVLDGISIHLNNKVMNMKGCLNHYSQKYFKYKHVKFRTFVQCPKLRGGFFTFTNPNQLLCMHVILMKG